MIKFWKKKDPKSGMNDCYAPREKSIYGLFLIYFLNALYLENGDVDLQTTTRHQVFKKVNNNATAAMQYYVFPTGSFDINLKTLLAWLRSYRNLFTEKCSKCSQFFDKDGVMPTWRDFKALTAQHDGCRNQY